MDNTGQSSSLENRIDKLERSRVNPLLFFVQFLLTPVLLVVVGFICNTKLEGTKQKVQSAELEIKRIDAAQRVLEQMFADKPERAFAAERLLSKIVDKQLSDEISSIVSAYYANRVSQSDAKSVEQITNAAKQLGGDAGTQLIKTLEEHSYFVVVAAFTSEQDALAHAKTLEKKGAKPEVWLSDNGRYAVTLGRHSVSTAARERDRAIAEGVADADAYLSNGAFQKLVYPPTPSPTSVTSVSPLPTK